MSSNCKVPPIPAIPTGPRGLTGRDGKSAYEIAVDNGFIGTVEQWLLSLKGETGEGTQGLSAYEIWILEGNVGSISDFLDSLKGTNGTNGTNGENGTNGLSAYQIAVQNGFVGNVSQWLLSLKGDTGNTGATGETGPQGEQGIPGPVNFNIYKFDFDLSIGTPHTVNNKPDNTDVIITADEVIVKIQQSILGNIRIPNFHYTYNCQIQGYEGTVLENSLTIQPTKPCLMQSDGSTVDFTFDKNEILERTYSNNDYYILITLVG